jgi:hypothetical protein
MKRTVLNLMAAILLVLPTQAALPFNQLVDLNGGGKATFLQWQPPSDFGVIVNIANRPWRAASTHAIVTLRVKLTNGEIAEVTGTTGVNSGYSDEVVIIRTTARPESVLSISVTEVTKVVTDVTK